MSPVYRFALVGALLAVYGALVWLRPEWNQTIAQIWFGCVLAYLITIIPLVGLVAKNEIVAVVIWVIGLLASFTPACFLERWLETWPSLKIGTACILAYLAIYPLCCFTREGLREWVGDDDEEPVAS